MEGPSLVLLTEELKPFYKKKVRKAEGLLLANFPFLKSSTFKSAKSWGKHLILLFDKGQLRIHFLMFGSYRVDQPRDRDPKLSLKFEGGTVYFYSCAIKEISKADIADYDFTIDLMSDQWDEKKAVKSIRSKPETQLGDILMDQAIFSGLGNIIKNEILFALALHPELLVGDLPSKAQLGLVRKAREYSLQFYEWKKINQLKRHWKVFRKRVCAVCGGVVVKKHTGVGQRVSYICAQCQPLAKAKSRGKKL